MTDTQQGIMPENTLDWKQWRGWLIEGAGDLGIDLDQCKVSAAEVFAKELLEAGAAMNLTSVDDPLELAEILMLDSMVPGKYISSGARVLDLGTGAGIPGIPLKIAFPALNMTLIDGRRKRVNFVKYVIRQLRMENTGARHIRAEELAGRKEKFDVVLSRAVSSIGHLHRLASPLLEKEGMLIAMKGRGYASELETEDAGTEQNSRLQAAVADYKLPGLGIRRFLVMLRPSQFFS